MPGSAVAAVFDHDQSLQLANYFLNLGFHNINLGFIFYYQYDLSVTVANVPIFFLLVFELKVNINRGDFGQQGDFGQILNITVT